MMGEDQLQQSGGVKFDEGKLRMDLLPVAAIEDVAEVLTHGALKYAPRNWEKGIADSRLYASTQRHLAAFWKGEDVDPDSGLRHLAHAACNVMMLLHQSIYEGKYVRFHDRPEYEKASETEAAKGSVQA